MNSPAATPEPKPSVSSNRPGTNPHFEGLGGVTTIKRLAERFYEFMDTLPEAKTIRALHPPDLSRPREVLTRYLIEWTGGPADYSKERGHPRLRKRHQGLSIGPAERDAWMLCMERALAEVVSREDLRLELQLAFYKVADFIRNDPDTPHEGPHRTLAVIPHSAPSDPDQQGKR